MRLELKQHSIRIMASNWDQELTKLGLHNVRIHASSLTEVWKSASTQYLVRSVLAASNRALEGLPFDYESATCTVKDLNDAVAATYGLQLVRDEHTSVAWFHPIELAYDRILATKVHVERDHLGLPMQSGILEPLADSSAAGITVKRWSNLFQNTFDYAVDVPAGVYSIRDLLNLCCVANPTKTFFVQVRDGPAFVTSVNLVSDEARAVPVGALRLWDINIGQGRGQGAPTQEQVMTALADQESQVRHAARGYLEAIIWSAPVDEWLRSDTPTAKLLWTCIGVTSVLVRSEEATHRVSIETMERLATGDFLAECEPGLAVMTALDLARLTKDARALEVVTKRNFGTNELAGITSDACRVAALSGYVRKALQTKSAHTLVDALRPLAAMVRLPNAGKLKFKIASAL
jgi:hypothetical protein